MWFCLMAPSQGTRKCITACMIFVVLSSIFVLLYLISEERSSGYRCSFESLFLDSLGDIVYHEEIINDVDEDDVVAALQSLYLLVWTMDHIVVKLGA